MLTRRPLLVELGGFLRDQRGADFGRSGVGERRSTAAAPWSGSCCGGRTAHDSRPDDGELNLLRLGAAGQTGADAGTQTPRKTDPAPLHQPAFQHGMRVPNGVTRC